uniref:Uncharacterized protein n=1 Tax=Anguilla anguilla TaxID=7936 RepID=A0A0E9TJP6_ANGAN
MTFAEKENKQLKESILNIETHRMRDNLNHIRFL